MDMAKLMGDQDHIRENLFAYVQAFSPDARDIFDRFDFATQIEKLAKCGLLYQVTEKFARIDLHPEAVGNHEMGLAFEELIRKFAELSNETAGEHFTPREVIRLMVNLLFVEDDEVLSGRHLQLNHRGREVHTHELVGFVIAVATHDEMHDALAREPRQRRRRENREPVQGAERGGHDHEGHCADRHGQGHALQHTTRHQHRGASLRCCEKVNAPRAA